MPLRHCDECHHELEDGGEVCDWCGAESYILQDKTALELFTELDIAFTMLCPAVRGRLINRD